MEDIIWKKAREWSQNNAIDQKDRQEIADLVAKGDSAYPELKERFYKDLEFGTGGLRSILGMGSNRMNKYNVRRATQAMANIVRTELKSGGRAVISYDCRQFSFEFAKEVASVFAANGIEAYIFSELTPTPMLSFALRELGAHTGVMITASHNPKEYNGFKAYWQDGAQVTPPQDNKIINAYNQLEDWSHIKTMSFDKGIEAGQIIWVSNQVNEKFYKILEGISLNPSMCQEHGHKLSVVYTSLHGTGLKPCLEISHRLGFKNFKSLKAQEAYDSSFSTVATTPNPEDPKALSLAVENMLASNCDLVYGTDPDCDRLGVVVNHQGKPYYLNGNQIGILLLNYMFNAAKNNKRLPAHPLVLKSIVTTGLINTITKAFGGETIETLTGFKWMAQKWRALEEAKTNLSFFYATEESFGYMTHAKARDKDAVGAVAMMNETALHYKLKGKTLIDALDEIYEQFGYNEESLISKTYTGLIGAEKIKKIMSYFRENHKQIADYKVLTYDDYEKQISINLSTNKTNTIDMEKSDVIGLTLEDGHKLFLRPSGTEPKIKFYTMVSVTTGELEAKKKNAKKIIDKIETFVHKKLEQI